MLRYGFVLLFSVLIFSQNNRKEIPPFIFADLDRVAVSLWLAAEAKDLNQAKALVAELEASWHNRRPKVEAFLENANAPIKLLPMVDNMLPYFDRTLAKRDYPELSRLSARFMREFRFTRSYYRQYDYPLDAFWNAYPVFLEIDFATNDAALGLFEWQELECLFDEFSCMINDYEQLAEAHLTVYAPQVDEDAHKAAMNRIYECIADYKDALSTGYREELVWPCNQIGESLLAILSCYSLTPMNF